MCPKSWYKRPSTTLGTKVFALKNTALSVTKLSLQSTTRKHSCHSPETPRSQDREIEREGGREGEGEREKRQRPFLKKKKKKRQQYIKCFFFNETNPKDVQSGSSCAVHKHGENKQNDRVETGGVNPRRGWTCHQEGFSWMGPGPGPQGWAQAQQAQASLHSAPGWLASLCPHFLEKQERK